MGTRLGRFIARVFGKTSPSDNPMVSIAKDTDAQDIQDEEEPGLYLTATSTTVTTGPRGRDVNGVFTPQEVVDMGDGIWVVESEAITGKYYPVSVSSKGWDCDCPDYDIGRQRWKRGVRTCKHIGLVIARSGLRPALNQVIRSTGEIKLANDNFLDWYVREGLYERHGLPRCRRDPWLDENGDRTPERRSKTLIKKADSIAQRLGTLSEEAPSMKLIAGAPILALAMSWP